MSGFSSELCAILSISRKEYEIFSSRLSSYGILSLGTKQLEVNLSQFVPENLRKLPQEPRKQPRKLQQSLIRVSDNLGSTYLFCNRLAISASPSLSSSSSSPSYDNSFIYQATYLRSDNNFQGMIKNWSLFSEMKEIFTKVVEVEIYEWKDSFYIEAVHGDKDQILLVFVDRTSMNHIQKSSKRDYNEVYWRDERLGGYLKDFYRLLCCNYNETNGPQPVRVPQGQNIYNRVSEELRQKLGKFASKLVRFQNKSENKIVELKTLKTGFIVDLVLRNYVTHLKDMEMEKE